MQENRNRSPDQGVGQQERTRRGHLKIFFGYAAGVGKASAMIESGREAAHRGVDVVVGVLENQGRKDRSARAEGLEHLPEQTTEQGTRELDLDAAIARRPQLLLVEDLSHTNASACRHDRRYQDVEELLKAGIDVYTTVNVQQIESLHDLVETIIDVPEQECIPDSIFDNADQVELIDLEPQELIDRWMGGQIGDVKNFPDTLEKLTALREIALRRCADRMNLLTESVRSAGGGDYQTDEHILVCLSSSPSNANIIRTAARMASAFRCSMTALFVRTPDFPAMSGEDRRRLQANMRLAQQLEARIETVYGDDIPFQIAEYARVSGITKIVIGRSAVTTRRGVFSKPTLTDRLIANAPRVDIHIIPDAGAASSGYRIKRMHQRQKLGVFCTDVLKSTAILAAVSVIGLLFDRLQFAEANIITVYVLGVLLTSVVTSNRIYSLISSVVSVLVFNFLFTDPKFTLQAYDQGYPVTFVIMFLAAFLTGTLATKLKSTARQSAQAAFRTKVLFDASQMLQQARDRDEIFSATAKQLTKLLQKDIVIYPAEKGNLGEPRIFPAADTGETEDLLPREHEVADWVLHNNKHAGATTQTFSDARCLYLAIRVNDSVYGVLGIAVGQTPMDGFENSILLSILGECALALENEQNAREKEEAAILARNEQLRANLLRAISHDLRTPLTSISGNASNLLSNGDFFDGETKKQLYKDIYSDAMWLIDLVENLLSVTRLEQGQLNLNVSENLLDDVITEALRHVNRKLSEHEIRVESEDEFLLARMDAKLIVQVVINLVDNAIKYTPDRSHILISTRREGNMAVVSVADDGGGIPDEVKPRVFDMFYSGSHRIADSRRSLGLGLSLCKSIIAAHGGAISVGDNTPHGAVFTFTLPIGEVTLHES